MSEVTLQIYGKDALRLVRGGRIVGMLLRMADDRWCICDTAENRLTKRTFLRAGMARDHAVSEGLI